MKRLIFNIGLCSMIAFFALYALIVMLFAGDARAQVKTIDVEKISVTLVSDNGQGQGQYAITLQCSLLVDDVPEYSFTVKEDYNMGDSIVGLYGKFEDDMNAVIAKYNGEQTIYNHAQLDNIITTLESNLSW